MKSTILLALTGLLDHAPADIIERSLLANLTKRSEAIAKKKPMAHVLKYCYEIVRRLDFLAGACHSYGNPIVQLLCEFFGYKLMMKDSMKDRDYVIYSLLKETKEKEHFVSAVIIDAKHYEKLSNSLIAQAMGYYCKAKQSNNQSGFAMLLNEFDEKIHAKFFLFPYKDKEDPEGKDSGYCIQSLYFRRLSLTYQWCKA